MRRAALTLAVGLVVGLAVGVLGTRLLSAPSEGIKRTRLLKTDRAGIEGREAVMGLAEVALGVADGRHSHDRQWTWQRCEVSGLGLMSHAGQHGRRCGGA
jgi:hypothetical protein